MTSAMNRGLTVLIADEREEALEPLGTALQALGHDVTPYAVSVAEASELIAREEPDLAIVAVHHDDDHALALIAEAVEFAPGPVIAYAAHEDAEFVARAAEHGISAYLQSLSAEAVQGAIEVALRRHREKAALSEKVEQLENALARRALIERAKGILMERHSLDDGAAFALLRDHARSQNRRVVDVAAAVTEGHALLPKG
jgi:AmiR/NasT family two-component response regulator